MYAPSESGELSPGRSPINSRVRLGLERLADFIPDGDSRLFGDDYRPDPPALKQRQQGIEHRHRMALGSNRR